MLTSWFSNYKLDWDKTKIPCKSDWNGPRVHVRENAHTVDYPWKTRVLIRPLSATSGYRPLPIQAGQMKVILLFQGAEGKPAMGGRGGGHLGAGTGARRGCHRIWRPSLDEGSQWVIPQGFIFPRTLWGNSYCLYFSTWKNWDNSWLHCPEVAESGLIRTLVFQG